MQVELAVMVGMQASGKSTFCRTCLPGHVVVSKDDFPRARRRQARQMRLVHEHLGTGRDVVVDNTNPSPEQWLPLIVAAHEHGGRAVAYWFPLDVDAARERNALRPADIRVPDVGLYATLKVLRRPTRRDGFAEVVTVCFDGAGGFTVAREED